MIRIFYLKLNGAGMQVGLVQLIIHIKNGYYEPRSYACDLDGGLSNSNRIYFLPGCPIFKIGKEEVVFCAGQIAGILQKNIKCLK